MGSFLDFFPYDLRTHQTEIMEDIFATLETGGHLVLESGTGTGKTICALVPILNYAIENDKRILYCTRTNSQQRQVIYEMRAIKSHLEQNGFESSRKKCLGLGMQGRQNLCLLARDNPEFLQSTAEELSKICTDRKNSSLATKEGKSTKIPGCSYYERMLSYELDPVKEWIQSITPTAEEIVEYCSDNGICPYELCKSLLKECVLVAAPYIYLFQPYIRQRLLEWLNCNIDDIILVIDEAHNLPDYARELGSMQLSSNTLKIAREEAVEFGDPSVSDNVSTSYFIAKLQDILWDMKNEYVIDEDGLVPPEELKVELMTRLQVISNRLKVMVKNIIILGEVVRGKRRKMSRLPRSYLYSVGRFLENWFELEADTHVQLIVDGDNPKLEAYCLDPSIITEVVNSCFASLHISGTLNPLEEYRDSIGLSKTNNMQIYLSPFPKKNRKILYTEDVTTKFETMKADEKIFEKIEDYIQTVCSKSTQNTIVFFPSYKLLNQFLHHGLHFTLPRKFYIEQQNMGQRQLMELVETFKKEAGVLFAVMGGRISEGMDFPGKELELVVLVGIPYPKPTARQKALQDYYDKKFNKGWEYTVHAPTTRKMLQSIGRLIRTENDKGLAVILDSRAVHFKEHLKGLASTDNIIQIIYDFF